jgi:hypothetical protein
MNKIISIFVFAAILVFTNACNQTNNKQNSHTEKSEVTISYLSVDDVFAQGDSLVNKTIHVEGIIEHVCKHTWKRFKIIGANENQFIKIELGEKFPTVDATILGKKVKVTGKLIPIKMDKKMVMKWEEIMKENHKGEENTEHYKEELKFIQNIHNQITNGEIPYYINYTIEAESYELE